MKSHPAFTLPTGLDRFSRPCSVSPHLWVAPDTPKAPSKSKFSSTFPLKNTRFGDGRSSSLPHLPYIEHLPVPDGPIEACPRPRERVETWIMTHRNTPAMAWLSTAALSLAALSLGVASLWLSACSDPPKAKTPHVVLHDTPALLRGTIGSEVEFHGIEPILVSGIGLVVGLDGTGGDTLPDGIAATMEREMGLRGVSKSNEDGTAFSGKSPREVLRDKNVAVVLVQAAIPPGAPANATFDVRVQAINATSLEGGRLLSTDLQLGQASTFTSVQAHKIAVAGPGPIFINPFAEPGKESSGVTLTSGRVLDGGRVTSPLGIEMALANSSFARARAIVSAINTRFPPLAGDPVPTARGRSGPDLKSGVGGSIELHVPARFRKTPSDFLDLVRHLQVEQGYPEQYARRYVEGLKTEPALGEDLSWCLEALGPKAIPFMRELYDNPELVPSMAALKAGARLDDPYAASYLSRVAKTAHGGVRTQAIAFLGMINADMKVDLALQDLLKEKELDVRIAAYEALVKRAEQAQLTAYEDYQEANPDAPRYSPTFLQNLAAISFSGRSVQGIERNLIDDKFLLDIVPVGDPMIYITQQGQPRIVLFGEPGKGGIDLVRPMVVSAWSDRLMMTTVASADVVHVRYQPANSDRAMTRTVRATLPQLIQFMARKVTTDDPRPGLDMSYSEVVGALYALGKGGGTRAAFTTENDRLQAQLAGARSSREITERPENAQDRELVILHKPEEQAAPSPAPNADAPKIVPIAPPDGKKKG